jgi:hypothetical protein
MWEILQDPSKFTNHAAAIGLLNELGISSKDDLEFVDKDHFESLCSYLKPIPLKRFKATAGI